MSAIRIFDEHETEYQTLKNAAETITKSLSGKAVCHVDVTYFDYGQDWRWTTIICEDHTRSTPRNYQLLCPKDQETILYGSDEARNNTVQNLIQLLLTK